jgi:RNA recognition motif-containing protein
MTHDTTEIVGKKRKAGQDEAELEIDLDAPEPASKKALRKAKKSKNALQHKVDTTADRNETSRTTKADKGRQTQSGIWIGNLPYTTTKTDLQTFLTTDSSHVIKPESISRINLPMNAPKHGKSQNKGFAYVDLTGAEVLERALQLSEKLFLGRRVLIKNAKSFEGRPSSAATNKKESSERAPNSRIFVGNLGFDTTVEDLENHFQICGPVLDIKMATFEDSGKCKGYAWVEFEQLSSAESAMRGWVEVDDMEAETKANKKRVWVSRIEGRKLRMEYAEDKTTRYNKRFGKEARAKEDRAEEVDVVGAALEESGTARSESKTRKPARSKDRKPEPSNPASVTDRGVRGRKIGEPFGYARDTVERLRGAIVPGEGKKVTFD